MYLLMRGERDLYIRYLLRVCALFGDQTYHLGLLRQLSDQLSYLARAGL